MLITLEQHGIFLSNYASFCRKQGLFQLFWEKAPGLNREKYAALWVILGFVFKCKLLNSKKKTLKHVPDHDDFIHVYIKS